MNSKSTADRVLVREKNQFSVFCLIYKESSNSHAQLGPAIGAHEAMSSITVGAFQTELGLSRKSWRLGNLSQSVFFYPSCSYMIICQAEQSYISYAGKRTAPLLVSHGPDASLIGANVIVADDILSNLSHC